MGGPEQRTGLAIPASEASRTGTRVKGLIPENGSDLFGQVVGPEGFCYFPQVISTVEEERLIAELQQLPLQYFAFHGFTGARQVVSFGWRYDFNEGRLDAAPPVPEFLQPLRARAARFARLGVADLQQALVTRYPPGAGIGWHRDRPQFDEVVGVSLGASCALRFRQRRADGWRRMKVIAEPRSLYLLSGAARTTWEHSIPPVESERFSVTFRALRT